MRLCLQLGHKVLTLIASICVLLSFLCCRPPLLPPRSHTPLRKKVEKFRGIKGRKKEKEIMMGPKCEQVDRMIAGKPRSKGQETDALYSSETLNTCVRGCGGLKQTHYSFSAEKLCILLLLNRHLARATPLSFPVSL